ncbi:hypothetical protein [Desulfonema magnum]|uniref:hypothetical protein n=1 Tax=Desulfonema magnum TaxID=45655 RepID=UPI001A9BBE5F|nr:hypothetical protein [Desulfonema magnum]
MRIGFLHTPQKVSAKNRFALFLHSGRVSAKNRFALFLHSGRVSAKNRFALFLHSGRVSAKNRFALFLHSGKGFRADDNAKRFFAYAAKGFCKKPLRSIFALRKSFSSC